jgi:DNA-binding response OmpR family regulator
MKEATLELLGAFSVLVVEDDYIARNVIKDEIKRHFRNFYEASDGLEGLELFKKYRIDIIVTDIHLPHISGLEMIDEILKIKPNQPFIVITSYDTDKNIIKSVQSGAINFLCKPITDIKNLEIALLLALGDKNKQKMIALSDNIAIDAKNELIYQNKQPLFLSCINNRLFWLLFYNIDKVVSYDMIEDYVYDNQSVNNTAVRTAILRLRKQLEGINIENIANVGYALKRYKA